MRASGETVLQVVLNTEEVLEVQFPIENEERATLEVKQVLEQIGTKGLLVEDRYYPPHRIRFIRVKSWFEKVF